MFMCALSRAYVAPEVVLESLRSFCDSCVLSLFLGRGLAFQDLLSAFCAFCSAWWDLAQSRGLWAMEAGITALRGMGSELWASGTPCPGAAFPRFKVLE